MLRLSYMLVYSREATLDPNRMLGVAQPISFAQGRRVVQWQLVEVLAFAAFGVGGRHSHYASRFAW